MHKFQWKNSNSTSKNFTFDAKTSKKSKQTAKLQSITTAELRAEWSFKHRASEREKWVKVIAFLLSPHGLLLMLPKKFIFIASKCFLRRFRFLEEIFQQQKWNRGRCARRFFGESKKKCKSISLGWNDRKDFLMLHRSSWQWWKVRVKVECVCYDWCWDACEHN